jgi:hypothetical protein
MPLRGASMPPSLEDFHRRVMRAASAATAGGRLASTIELSYKAARNIVAAVHRAAGRGAKIPYGSGNSIIAASCSTRGQSAGWPWHYRVAKGQLELGVPGQTELWPIHIPLQRGRVDHR